MLRNVRARQQPGSLPPRARGNPRTRVRVVQGVPATCPIGQSSGVSDGYSATDRDPARPALRESNEDRLTTFQAAGRGGPVPASAQLLYRLTGARSAPGQGLLGRSETPSNL